MKNFKRLFLTMLACSMLFTFVTKNVFANPTLEIVDVVVNTRAGDGSREVIGFQITVNDISLVSDLVASDFEITNNTKTTWFDPEINNFWGEYDDDGISIEIVGNKIVINCEPFNYNGKATSFATFDEWVVTCSKYPELSISKSTTHTITTKTIDDAIRGTYTYAGLTRDYALYLPTDTNGNYKTNVPIVIWNHGGGEYAGNLENTIMANRGLSAWPEAGYDTAVLVVQISNANYSYESSNDEAKKSLIDQNNALQAAIVRDLIANGTVDPNRVYVTGASSGGGATMRFVMQFPELIAGTIAICSMDPIVNIHRNSSYSYETIVEKLEEAFQDSVYTWDEETSTMISKDVNTEALIDVPIYFVHAQNDTTCNVNSSNAMYEALYNLGARNNEILIYSNDNMADNGLASALLHWSWVSVFNHNEEGSPMNWLFKQVKSNVTFDFDLNAYTYDYGEAINQVVIDLAGSGLDSNVTEFTLDPDTFTVLATATNPYDLAGNPSYGVYTDVERTIESITVKNGKIYIDLACSYNGAGQGTLNYVGGVARNLSMDISYTIIQNENIIYGSDVIKAMYSSFNQESIINEETEQFLSESYDGINYRYYVPENANDGEDLPLIVWFHGNGEGGYSTIQNNESQLTANRGAVAFATDEAQEIFGGAYILAPQAPDTWYNGYTNGYNETMYEIIMKFAEENNIDLNRIYVYGASAGGYMTLRMAIDYPDLFAAVVPTCPALDVAQYRGGVATTDEEILSLSNTPMWLIQAKNDTTVLEPDCAGRVAGLLSSAIYSQYDTVNVDGVEYPGHWSWIYTARNMPENEGVTVWEWTALQSKVSDVLNPDNNKGNDVLTPDNSGTITQTGDTTNVIVYVFLCLVSLTGVVFYVNNNKKKEVLHNITKEI